MMYLHLIGCFIILIISCLWLWFKRPVYIYNIYRWYIIQRYGIKISYLDLGDVIMHISEIGILRKNKSSLLLIHGAGGHSFNWIHMIQNIDREKEHIIIIDLPGHGNSTIPIKNEVSIDECVTFIKESLNKLGLENQPLHLIGQSLGGYLSGEFAVKYPNNVKLLTLVAPAGFGEVTNEFYEKITKCDFSWIMPTTVEEIKQTMCRCMVNPPKIPNQLLCGILEQMKKRYPFLEQMLRMWMNANINGIFKISHLITQPTQIIWGTEDQLLPVENAELLSKHLPNCCDKIIIDECGHSIHFEKPDILASVIMNFRFKNGIY